MLQEAEGINLKIRASYGSGYVLMEIQKKKNRYSEFFKVHKNNRKHAVLFGLQR
jgi:hypothetical protein